MTAMKRKGTQWNRGIILGYFSNLAVEVCPAGVSMRYLFGGTGNEAKADLLSKYAIDASTPDDRSIAGEEMDGYERITWISPLFPAGVLQSA